MSTPSNLGKWLQKKEDDNLAAPRLQFINSEPEIGERCIMSMDGRAYFGTRTSFNYYQSGNLTIPKERIEQVVTLREVV